MILLIDNYDSFVYNLARYVSELGYQREVVRHDAITLAEIQALKPTHIILSPGPCTPDEAGICLDIVEKLGSTVPILGVCLGHQVIGQVYGGRIARAIKPMHGKTSQIHHHQAGLFTALPHPLTVVRYHSLIVDHLQDAVLNITATSNENEVMAVAHRDFPVYGVQFHPEAEMTECGRDLLANFLSI